MKKITTISGHLSYLIDELADIYNSYGETKVSICGTEQIHIYMDTDNDTIVLDCEGNLEDTDKDDIISKLNKEFEISKVSGRYMTDDTKEIIADNIGELVDYYIDVFNYKMEQLFNNDNDVREFYKNIITQLREYKEAHNE